MEEVLQAVALKQQLDSLRPIDKEQEGRIMQKFRLDWNYHSNNLEGNSLTYGETKALLMYGVTALGKPLKDHFEVTGHNEAIDWVIEMVNGDRPLTENFIRELHTLLLKEPYEVDAITPDGKPTKKRIKVGEYKSSPNHVKTRTGEIFYFATPEETPSKMADLMAWYNEVSADESFNKILLAAEFHYKFIRIHPFDDGNGRTARILMNFVLMKFGYPPVIIKTEDKANYFAALQLADTGNLEAFVAYIAKNLVHSLEIMIAGANGESIEEPDDIDKEIALLEKRLKGLGDEIEPKPSKVVNQVLEDIRKVGRDVKDKLSRFNNYYFTKRLAIQINGEEYEIEDERQFESIINIRLFIYYDKLKKPGLENFRFHDEVIVKFFELYYDIFRYQTEEKLFLRKFYTPLSENENKKLLDDVLENHNKLLTQALNLTEKGGQ
jgi:Fic family protein